MGDQDHGHAEEGERKGLERESSVTPLPFVLMCVCVCVHLG